jgi:hypothetical protein
MVGSLAEKKERTNDEFDAIAIAGSRAESMVA